MRVDLDRYYESVKDLVPPDLKTKLDAQRADIRKHIDEELGAFETQLAAYLHTELERAEQQLTNELAQRRAAVHAILQQLQTARDQTAGPLRAAAEQLLREQAAYEERLAGYGRVLRQTLVTGLQVAGLSVPGLGAVAGLVGSITASPAPAPAPHPADGPLPTAPPVMGGSTTSPFTLLAAATAPTLGTAVALGQMALLAYEDGPTVRARMAPWQAEVIGVIQDPTTGTEGFAARAGNEVVVAFRGTEGNLHDLLTDAQCRRRRLDWLVGVEVHEGFAKAFSTEVRNALASALAQAPGCRVWICGHSLGGALAVLAAAWLASQGRAAAVAGIVTVGQPRVGDRVFTRWYDGQGLTAKHLRFVNDRDIVPCVPPAGLGYDHIGRLELFTDDGCLRQDAPRLRELVEDLVSSVAHHHLADEAKEFLEDHRSAAYQALLEAAWRRGDPL